MIAIIDYGLGNLFSLRSSLRAVGAESVVTDDAALIRRADRLILPGVGAFRDAAAKLREKGLDELIREEAASGKLLLGICLGMQLLFDESLEFGRYPGLGLIHGTAAPIPVPDKKTYKLPQIGWNALHLTREHPLFAGINEGDHVYFVHSYHGTDCEADTIATTEYGTVVTAAVARENVWGTQFHPEKSGRVGLEILRAFAEQQVAK